MSRNGTGIYVLPVYGNPVVNGTVIDPVWANGNFSDMATALTTSVSSDGQTPITGNLMMSGFKHTGAAAATGAGQYQVWGTAGNFAGLTSSAAIGVALATPSDARYTFDVLTVAGGAVGFNNSGSTNAYGAISGSVYVGTAQSFPLILGNAGLERMRIDTAGNVGVGTATPLAAAGFTYLTVGNSTSGSGLDLATGSTRLASFNSSVSGVATIGTELSQPFSIYTATVLRVTVGATGAVTMPSQPCVQANRSTSDTYTTNTYTKVAFDAKTIDVASNFATGTFTAPVAGTYQVSFNGYMDSVTTSGELGIRLYKNGTTVGVVFETHLDSSGTAAYSAFSRTGFITLAASDTVELYMAKINGATVNAYQTTLAIRLMQ